MGKELSLKHVFKVLLIVCLGLPFVMLEWFLTIKTYTAPGSNDSLLLIVCGLGGMLVGGWLGSLFAGAWKNIRAVAALGTLLTVPFMFSFYEFVVHKIPKDSWYW